MPDPSPRPRLVVLVDNDVVGDSRVQKCSIAAAEAGWDVTLLGRSKTGVADELRLGDVLVRRINAPYALLAYERRAPRGRWRYPFSYRDREQVAMRKRLLDARARDVAARRVLGKQEMERLAAEGSVGRAQALVVKAGIVGRQYGQEARRYWHAGRNLQYKRAVAFVKKPHGPWERVRTEAKALVAGRRVWRSYDPLLWDLELAFGPAIDALQPDVIHANDFRMSGIAIRAKARAAARGRDVKVVYDVHEFVPGVRAHSRRWQLANQANEREYIGQADRVLTVSERLADMLKSRYRLPERPQVVLNAPQFDPDVPPVTTLRKECGVDDDTPLLVYSGGAAPQRGLLTMVDALPRLDGVHVAFVVPTNAFTETVLARAAELGVAGRVHVLPYVAQDQVVPFLASATAGVIPIHHFPNHEIALITKYFEYAHARLPIVVSDVETMAAQTRELGNGEVFRAEDVDDYVRAVRAVLADRARYSDVYDARPEVLQDWSWERQAAVLAEVYTQVSGLRPQPRHADVDPAASAALATPSPEAPVRPGGLSAAEPVLDDDAAADEPAPVRDVEPEPAQGGPA